VRRLHRRRHHHQRLVKEEICEFVMIQKRYGNLWLSFCSFSLLLQLETPKN
jgi:hypothetical protein